MSIKEYTRKKTKNGFTLSILALMVIIFAMPITIGAVQVWNDNISGEYIDYAVYNNETRQALAGTYLGGSGNWYGGASFLWYNTTGHEIDEAEFYEGTLFDDGHPRLIMPDTPGADDTAHKNMLTLGMNITVNQALNNGVSREHIYINPGYNLTITVRAQEPHGYGRYTFTQITLNETNNYSTDIDIETIKLIQASNEVGKDAHFTLEIAAADGEITGGDIYIVSWSLEKKQGHIATIYTIDNIMMIWGIILFGMAFASTPFFNPLSREVFPVWNKYKRSKAAKKAAASRKGKRRRKKSKRSRRR